MALPTAKRPRASVPAVPRRPKAQPQKSPSRKATSKSTKPGPMRSAPMGTPLPPNC